MGYREEKAMDKGWTIDIRNKTRFQQIQLEME